MGQKPFTFGDSGGTLQHRLMSTSLDVMTQISHFEFNSDAFPVSPGEDEETNPGIFGKSLAEWLLGRLQGRGLTAEEVIAEDFAWCVSVSCPPYTGYVACAPSPEDDSDWRVFAFVEGGLLSRLMGRDKRAESLDLLNATVKNALENASEIRDLREEKA
jgi:hypothetical protein